MSEVNSPGRAYAFRLECKTKSKINETETQKRNWAASETSGGPVWYDIHIDVVLL
jgi:hypothetical protein